MMTNSLKPVSSSDHAVFKTMGKRAASPLLIYFLGFFMRILLFFVLTIWMATGCENDHSSGSDPLPQTETAETEDETVNGKSAAIDIDAYIDPITIDVLNTKSVNSDAAYVTSQCYTRTEGEGAAVHNPCFSCHINSKSPNYIDDPDLQQIRDFGDYTKTNRWHNLFKDRTAAVAAISDAQILAYVRQDNYRDANGSLLLAEKLNTLPKEWDYDNDGKWDGYTPDCYFSFDGEGFDRTPEGGYTGWRAFAYYPFLGTFWPTNGSTDDVLIRLPDAFMQDADGTFDLAVYKINLAIVESLIKRSDIPLESPADETLYGVDLDRNGSLNAGATQITYDWAPSEGRTMGYVGAARELSTITYGEGPYARSKSNASAGLYPLGTEFLHSVRYIDVDESNGTVKMAPRMKELRYGKKTALSTYSELNNAAKAEILEKDAFPSRLRTILGDAERGLKTGLGWVYQGFIEDRDGELRPQNYEETQFCIGCHSGIGAIVDSTFVFARKFENNSTRGGWYHWSRNVRSLEGIAEPLLADGRGEYSLYLEQNHAGDEFRGNDEVAERFFDDEGGVDSEAVEGLKTDISTLLLPSAGRALELNKAYLVIVKEQSYIYGRDAHISPVTTVYKTIDTTEETGVAEPLTVERYPLR